MNGRKGPRPSESAAAPPAPDTPTHRISEYTVFPSRYDQVEDPSRSRWCLTVADTGDGWVIRQGDACLNIFNQWEREAPTDFRDAEFRRRCVHNEHAAPLRARRVVDDLDVGGITFEEFVWKLQDAEA